MHFYLIIVTLLFFFKPGAVAHKEPENESLRFTRCKNGSFSFNTGVLEGDLRQYGKSIGLFPVIYKTDSIDISAREGLFNHYRVFTRGKRYGYGARRWFSIAKLNKDGSVEALWPVTNERPFELRALYRLVAPNTIDLITTVHAKTRLEAFEVFLASYFPSTYTDSRVWGYNDVKGDLQPGFVSAKRELGEWLAFPRDEQALKIIEDGRWTLEPHPLEWTIMPNYDLPIAIRRDTISGLTVIGLTQQNDCFGIFTPYGEEKHFSSYISLFGYDIEAGDTVSARSRLIVLPNPTEEEILEVAEKFLSPSP